MSISSIIDIAVVLIILVSAGVSFFRGFVREVLTIFGVLGGAFGAYMFGSKLSPVFRGWFGVEEGKTPEKLFDLIPYTIVADVCAYAGIFIAIFLILQLVSYFMSASIKAIGLGPVDRSLGVAFGIARAMLFLGVIYLVLGGLIPDDNRQELLGKSKTIVYIEAVSDWMKGFIPSNSGEKAQARAEDFTKDKLKEIQVLGVEAADKAGEKANDIKQDLIKTQPYNAQERRDLDKLIENESGPDTALPERSAPNE